MKKIIIVAIVVLGLLIGVGVYFVNNNSEKKINKNYKQSIVNSANSNNAIKSSINKNNETNKKDVTLKNINNAQTQNLNNITVSNNPINKKDTVASSNNIKSAKSVSSINSNIEWILEKNQSSTQNTIVVRNNTGEEISNQQLVKYIKNWILNAQINYSQTFAGDMWVPEFFNVVPDNDLVQAFINANGEASLIKNITAGELASTNVKLMKMISENQPLLSQSQIFEYIYQNILPKNKISKIENHKDSYFIYSRVNGKQVLWNSLDKYTGITSC